MTAKEIKDLSLTDLGLPTKTRNNLLLQVWRWTGGPIEKKPDLMTSSKKTISEWYNSWATRTTVLLVMLAWEDSCRRHTGIYPDNSMKRFIGKLVELGLTKIDWIHMPSTTIKDEEVAVLTKERLLRQSIVVLKTISGKAQNDLAYFFKKDVNLITIGQLLFSGNEPLSRWQKSYDNTIARLRGFGFSREDGPLMPATPDERLEDVRRKLLKRRYIGKKIAEVVLTFAKEEGWI